MPELVGIFNAFGGGASALVAIAEFLATPGIGASTTGVTSCLDLNRKRDLLRFVHRVRKF
ncbi:MAG: hypothetical protein Ct9H300mP15_09440 [Gemmatimonadota bacterium]|nr:MAG: hypothetical protein Ct9H300mP15_09440 [Gemmatimonadota bacterium]